MEMLVELRRNGVSLTRAKNTRDGYDFQTR